MTEWFTDWFGHTYLDVYPHRDDEDAREALGLVTKVVPLEGRRVLDLACGQGRHALQLDQLGARTTGVDLSAVLLKRARFSSPPVRDLVRADMRALPFKGASFDVVVNLFTSFGYFGSDDEHQHVLNSVSDLLIAGGWFVLDYLNADHVRAGLVPHERMDVNGKTITIRRRLVDGGAYVQKEVYLTDVGTEHVERVRLFSAANLADMLATAGLHVMRTFGDYAGGSLTKHSPRAVLFARKP